MAKKIKVENWLYVFFLFQPLVSIYRTFWGDNLKIFGFSLFEMINIVFIIGLWIYTALKLKNKKVLYIILYFIGLGIYCFAHYFNMSKFNTDIFERSMYGLIQESYYIFRVYGLPILLLFSLIYGEIKKGFFVRVISDISFLISSIIVITNLMGVSLCAYVSEGHVRLVQGSFLKWFSTNGFENMKNFTSVGWFDSANEVSGLLLMIFPIVVYQFWNKRTKENILRCVMAMLAMLMLGTKTATLGSGFVFILLGMVRIVMQISEKKYTLIKQSVILLVCSSMIWGIFFYYSPFLQEKFPHRRETVSSGKTQIKEKKAKREPIVLSIDTEEERNYAIMYIENNYWRHYVNKQYIDKYPVEKDLSFWVDVINRDSGINKNYRFFKKNLMRRMIERNGRDLDKLVGIGLFQEIDCEQDYVYQYFMFGIAGLVLIMGVYVLLLLKNIVLFVVRIKKYWNERFIAYMCAFGISLLLPYVTGHMIGSTMVMFGLVLIAALVEDTAKELQMQE